jgi:hypothetical protein
MIRVEEVRRKEGGAEENLIVGSTAKMRIDFRNKKIKKKAIVS